MRVKIAVLCVVTISMAMWAQDKSKVKMVPSSNTNAASGAQMYKHHCAACHGANGKGNGPAASALKTPPADLTSLARNNGGNFPELKVYNAIRGDIGVAAHGSKDMPVWGEVFSAMDSDTGQTSLRLRNLTKYLESLQRK